MRQKTDSTSFLWKLFSIIVIGVFLAKGAQAQLSPGFQSHGFQYLSGVLTTSQLTTERTANGFNGIMPPKYFSMGVTTTATGWVVALEGSLDNANWSTIAVTNSVFGVVSSILPKPMLYFRMRASTLSANTSVTATAIGTP